MLTGFQKWDSFQRLAMEEVDHFTFPVGVAICDINGLSVINSTRSNQAGDQRINALAGIMRKNFPERTYYVRGIDAHLIALCSHSSEEEMTACVEKVKEQYDGSIQYAVGVAADEGQSIVAAITDAATAMKTKKLVDSESSHSDMLTSLIRALEECDSDTEQHVRRTQELGAELGRRIELSDIQQSKLALLCLLHDIGKVGVPMEILNKPGKLTDEEWKIMRSHVEKGYEIAMSNTELRQIAEEIRHHHERWDGNGYPDGLSRESIPVLSRVIAVVDAFNAMINDRPYRKGMPISKAIEELKSCAGSQFDPYIVSEFIRLVSEKYADSLAADSKQRAADGGVGADGNEENVGDRTAPGDGLADADGDGASTDDEQTEIRIMARRQMVDFTEYGKDAFRVHTVKYSRYLVDENWRIISVDDNFEELTGYSKEDIENNIITQIDLIPDEDKTEYLCQVNANLAKSTFVFQEHKIHRKDGRDIYVLCTGRMFYDSALQKDRGEIVIVDVSSTYALKMLTDAEQNKADVRLRNWENTYRTDPLTGLLNHAAFRSDMEQRLLECTHTAVMIMMDVDRFKQYNDTYGHHNGDKYLVLVAQTLQAALRGDDHACRMGGDEFIIIVKPEQYDRLEQIIEEVQAIFNKPWFLHSADYYCTMSMGVVRFPKDANTVTDLIKKADISLYEAKKGGKNRVEYYGGDGEDTASRRLDMEKNMRDATANSCEEFEVYYQPVIDISGEKERCSGVEALVRWNSGKMGMVGPGEFIPLAEYLGLINPIGDFVLRKACEKCKYWNDMGHPEYRINVNLSVVQLLQNDIVERIRTVLEETKMRPENLTLEVTESLAINDIGRMKKVLSKIKELGALIALDDFGTGYSSLSHIRELPIDIIKIDRCFVIDLGKDDYAETFVRMVAELADTIGVRMCVEGVEYDEQLQILKDMKKVQYIQGYYYDKPLTEEAFEKKYL